MSTCFCLVTLFTISIGNGLCAGNGGPCYSRSQTICQHAWTNLWVANMDKNLDKICQYFGDVQKCTMDYKAMCKFKPHEHELYQNDIVKIYTRKPYSCAMMGGNIRYKGEYDNNSASRSRQSIFLIIFFTLVSKF